MKHIAALLLLLGTAASQAMCFSEAATRYQLPEDLIKAIARVESSNNPAAMNMSHQERTKSYDIGLMQINSSWLPRLASMGITEEKLKDACQNIYVGAWILSHHLKENGADWNGVGSYNASCRTLSKEKCDAARFTYSWKVYRALMRQRNLVPSAEAPIKAPHESSRPLVRSIRTVETARNDAAPPTPADQQDAAAATRIAALANVSDEEQPTE